MLNSAIFHTFTLRCTLIGASVSSFALTIFSFALIIYAAVRCLFPWTICIIKSPPCCSISTSTVYSVNYTIKLLEYAETFFKFIICLNYLKLCGPTLSRNNASLNTSIVYNATTICCYFVTCISKFNASFLPFVPCFTTIND